MAKSTPPPARKPAASARGQQSAPARSASKPAAPAPPKAAAPAAPPAPAAPAPAPRQEVVQDDDATRAALALSRPGSTALAQQVPVQTMQGMEEIEMDDMTLPRLAICQNTSDERKPGHAKYIEGLNDGMVFNTLTGDIISSGQDPIYFIPLFAFKTRIKFNEPIGSGIDCSSPNAKTGGRYSPNSCEACEHSQFSVDEDNKREKPACFLFYNYVVLLYSGDETAEDGIKLEPIVLSFKSSGVKVAKKFNTMIRQTMRPAAFMSFYRATTVLEKFTEGSAYNFSISYGGPNKGEIDDERVLARCAAFFGSMRPDVARAAAMKHAEEVAQEA